MKLSPQVIFQLEPNQIFVFGSNLNGWHGAGAALTARRKFGARPGQGVGMTGQCYAIPTKDEWMCSMSLHAMAPFIDQFVKYATAHPELEFLVTPVGCGLAGNSPNDIAKLFVEGPLTIPNNVLLPACFYTARLPGASVDLTES